MSIGKYVTNPGVIGAALGAASTAKRTQSMPKDWRRLLVWGIWLGGLALAIGSVAMQERDAEEDARKAQQPDLKVPAQRRAHRARATRPTR